MAIIDTGVPETDPHTVISSLLTTNMTSPDGTWTPAVNNGWLEYKKQKTFQIVIYPSYADSIQINLTGGISATEPRISTAYLTILLYAPDRDDLWKLYRKTIDVLNNETLTSPYTDDALSGVGGSDYHFIRVVRAEGQRTIKLSDDLCGPGAPAQDDCQGYRADITVALRWNE